MIVLQLKSGFKNHFIKFFPRFCPGHFQECKDPVKPGFFFFPKFTVPVTSNAPILAGRLWCPCAGPGRAGSKMSCWGRLGSLKKEEFSAGPSRSEINSLFRPSQGHERRQAGKRGPQGSTGRWRKEGRVGMEEPLFGRTQQDRVVIGFLAGEHENWKCPVRFGRENPFFFLRSFSSFSKFCRIQNKLLILKLFLIFKYYINARQIWKCSNLRRKPFFSIPWDSQARRNWLLNKTSLACEKYQPNRHFFHFFSRLTLNFSAIHCLASTFFFT